MTSPVRRSPQRGSGAAVLGELMGRWQVGLYLAAVLAGLSLGTAAPEVAGVAEPLLWPVLGALLLATFLQVPLRRLPEATRDRRFPAAVVIGNFVVVPLVVWGLLVLLPADPAVRLGVALVLLMPCTDWFIAFTHLGGGDVQRAIVVTPLNLLLQLAVLPVYLWLLAAPALDAFGTGRAVTVFLALVLAPLVTAGLVQRSAPGRPRVRRTLQRLEHAPVVLLAGVLLLVAASQVGEVAAVVDVLPAVLTAFVAFLALMLLLGRLLASGFGLAPRAARSLTFSLGTRNSFVVLPFALALPEAWHLAVAVVVLQSLVELFGMLAYLRVVPRLFPVASRSEEPER